MNKSQTQLNRELIFYNPSAVLELKHWMCIAPHWEKPEPCWKKENRNLHKHTLDVMSDYQARTAKQIKDELMQRGLSCHTTTLWSILRICNDQGLIERTGPTNKPTWTLKPDNDSII